MAAAAAGENSKLTVVRKTGEGKFTATIKHPVTKTQLWLGTYSSHEVTACAYDLAARELKGIKAKLNFPYPSPARLVKEVIAAPRHRSHGHDTPLFEVVIRESWNISTSPLVSVGIVAIFMSKEVFM
ncbi:hypothetical protein VPH35_132248 [Triticum aestivum]